MDQRPRVPRIRLRAPYQRPAWRDRVLSIWATPFRSVYVFLEYLNIHYDEVNTIFKTLVDGVLAMRHFGLPLFIRQLTERYDIGLESPELEERLLEVVLALDNAGPHVNRLTEYWGGLLEARREIRGITWEQASESAEVLKGLLAVFKRIDDELTKLDRAKSRDEKAAIFRAMPQEQVEVWMNLFRAEPFVWDDVKFVRTEEGELQGFLIRRDALD